MKNFLKKIFVTILTVFVFASMAACAETNNEIENSDSTTVSDVATSTLDEEVVEETIEEEVIEKDIEIVENNPLDNLLVIDVKKVVDGKFMSRGAYSNPDDFIFTISLNKNIVDVTFKDNYYCLVLNQRVGDKHVLVEVTFDDYVRYLELMCGTTYVRIDKSVLEINSPELTKMEMLQLEYDEALKNGDYEKLQEVINKIIEAQNKNGLVMTTETIIFVGRVYNCTTTYDVVEDAQLCTKTIKSKCFADRFPFERIQLMNITEAIEKATGYTAKYLRENNILVTISQNDGNGYDFYLTKIEF